MTFQVTTGGPVSSARGARSITVRSSAEPRRRRGREPTLRALLGAAAARAPGAHAASPGRAVDEAARGGRRRAPGGSVDLDSPERRRPPRGVDAVVLRGGPHRPRPRPAGRRQTRASAAVRRGADRGHRQRRRPACGHLRGGHQRAWRSARRRTTRCRCRTTPRSPRRRTRAWSATCWRSSSVLAACAREVHPGLCGHRGAAGRPGRPRRRHRRHPALRGTAAAHRRELRTRLAVLPRRRPGLAPW